MNGIKFFMNSFPGWVKLVLLTIVITDPCKSNKCMVRACCSKQCDKKIKYLYCFPDGSSIAFLRITSIMIVTSFLGIIYCSVT